jgi:hypothetical protein
MRVDHQTFLERYPDGSESRYLILGHTQARDMEGTVVVKTEGDPEKTQTQNDARFQVFIPDKGNKAMAILFRNVGNGELEWKDMSWSDNRPTLLKSVE